MKVRYVSPEEAPNLHRMIDELADRVLKYLNQKLEFPNS